MSGMTEDFFLTPVHRTAGPTSAGLLPGPHEAQSGTSHGLEGIAPASRHGAKAWQLPVDEWQRKQKTVFDCLVATCMLLLLAPFLVAVALLIALDSPGPVLFRQARTGLNNRPFMILKFRTMHHSMADALAEQQTTRNDPRVTRIGGMLRRLSIDELPQLLNVLRGDMSLVGPRPHAPNTKAAGQLFTDVVLNYALRHQVKPGITGWAQVNGWRGETKTVEEIQARVDHDLHYIQNWSMAFDVKIMLLTLLREVRSKTAF